MGDGNSRTSKLSWSKKIVRKLFNIKSKTEEFQAGDVYEEDEAQSRTNFAEREPSTAKKSKIEKFSRNVKPLRRNQVYLDNPRIIEVQNCSVFAATWNVAGRSPPSNLSLDDWLHASPPADIYVIGFQEIVPLSAGNILGAEKNEPARKWLALIRKTLNNLPGYIGHNGCYASSPVPEPIVEIDADFEESTRHRKSHFFHRRSLNDPSTSIAQPRIDGRFSVCDRVIFGQRPSDYDPRPSDYSRPSDWGSSDDDHGPVDSPSTVVCSPLYFTGSGSTEGYRVQQQSRYGLVASKQMVGIFLTVWVKNDMRDHVKNMKVSCVGRGLMGYLGNKGSISVSMRLHQTSFCFVCSHLTSGQKEGDELRRNLDVIEILKKTRFPSINTANDEKSPECILEHDRVIWLGDLNYRVALSYRSAKALVEMQNWRALLLNDQLRIEQKRGRVFVGWKEGKIYFPPTYKYSTNSDRYTGDDMHLKEKRRTPAWCDRILWHGEGLQQLSYVRAESRFSDHRPVYGIFWAEVESSHNSSRFKKSTSRSSSRIEVEELLPCAHGYTELSFF